MSGIDLKKQFEAAVNPPEGWQGDLFFYNRLGQKIRYGHAPAQGDKKGTIVLTHGYGEHIDLYHETIKRYQKMGYEVWAMDWQGHGKSERDNPANPLLPSTKSMMRQVRDLDYFVNNLVKTRHDPHTPLIMSTHSMGGHIGLLYLKKYPGVFDGAVMSAPMFDIYRLGLDSWARPGIRGIFNAAATGITLPLSRIGKVVEWFTGENPGWKDIKLNLRDTFVPSVDELQSILPHIGSRIAHVFKQPTTLRGQFRELVRELTPDAALGRPTFGWIASAYNTIVPSMKDSFLKSIKTPILIASAEHEDLVDNEAHKRAAGLMPNAQHVTIAGAGHGLWFEDDGPYDTWWGHITSFVGKLKPINPHESDNDAAVANIVEGENVEKTLRGRIVSAPRCPICPPDGPRPV